MPPAALVSKIDHVFVPVADPAPLFELFTGPLALPVAWPLHDYGIFRSGGVCLGNANIEFVTGDANLMPYFAPTEPLTVRGIGFEPVPALDVSALDERGLRHTDPLPFEGKGHTHDGVLWTNVFLSGMVGAAAVAFTCEFHMDETLRGDDARAALDAAVGGPLGVRELAEVTLGLADPEAAGRWGRFLAPVEPDRHGAYHLGEGPTLRVKPAPMDGVAGMWLEVESLDRAREALSRMDMLGPMRASGIGLDYARTGGLDVWLTEPR